MCFLFKEGILSHELNVHQKATDKTKKKVPKQGDILSLRIKIHSISLSPYQFGNVYLSIILVDKGRCVFLSRVLQSYSTRHVLKGLFHHILPCCWMLLHCRGHFREFADEGLIITKAWQRKKRWKRFELHNIFVTRSGRYMFISRLYTSESSGVAAM